MEIKRNLNGKLILYFMSEYGLDFGYFRNVPKLPISQVKIYTETGSFAL